MADYPVEDPAGLLSVDLIHVDLAGGGEGLGDSPLGYLVKNHSGNFVCGQLQGLAQVPGDGFAFAVQVGSQKNSLSARRHLGQALDNSSAVRRDPISRSEIIF